LYKRLTNEKQSETFFKVFYDRIQDAQQSIKASVSANADESLASAQNVENEDSVKDETKCKGGSSVICLIFIIFAVGVILVAILLSLVL